MWIDARLGWVSGRPGGPAQVYPTPILQMPGQFSAQIKRLRARLSDYGMLSLKVGLISDSGSHWSPYRDLYT